MEIILRTRESILTSDQLANANFNICRTGWLMVDIISISKVHFINSNIDMHKIPELILKYIQVH